MPGTQPFIVFVVDDEPIIASTLAAILNNSGFQATAFFRADEAMRAVESGAPNLLITDVDLPGMNGIELAVRFKTLCPDCKILLFSGQASTNDLLDSATLEGHQFELLAKPLHPRDLLAAIRNL
jgi:DNA-binding response OmpR family regulator